MPELDNFHSGELTPEARKSILAGLSRFELYGFQGYVGSSDSGESSSLAESKDRKVKFSLTYGGTYEEDLAVALLEPGVRNQAAEDPIALWFHRQLSTELDEYEAFVKSKGPDLDLAEGLLIAESRSRKSEKVTVIAASLARCDHGGRWAPLAFLMDFVNQKQADKFFRSIDIDPIATMHNLTRVALGEKVKPSNEFPLTKCNFLTVTRANGERIKKIATPVGVDVKRWHIGEDPSGQPLSSVAESKGGAVDPGTELEAEKLSLDRSLVFAIAGKLLERAPDALNQQEYLSWLDNLIGFKVFLEHNLDASTIPLPELRAAVDSTIAITEYSLRLVESSPKWIREKLLVPFSQMAVENVKLPDSGTNVSRKLLLAVAERIAALKERESTK